jgi:hypothetical protein
MRKLWCLCLAFLLATPLLASPVLAADRVALVIGNGAYSSGPLGSPVRDARANLYLARRHLAAATG